MRRKLRFQRLLKVRAFRGCGGQDAAGIPRLVGEPQGTAGSCTSPANAAPLSSPSVELLKGKKFCVDPEEGWFQQYLQQEESRSTST